MVAHLHPRSRSTLSLFTTCLTVSFLVVAAPHIMPCPVDRRQFNDSVSDPNTGEPRRRRRRKTPSDQDASIASKTGMAELETVDLARQRECPIPKPGGILGQAMGFRKDEREKPTVIVKSLRDRKVEIEGET